MTLSKKPFENIVGKVENTGYWHSIFFPQCFLSYKRQFSEFKQKWTFFLVKFCEVLTSKLFQLPYNGFFLHAANF